MASPMNYNRLKLIECTAATIVVAMYVVSLLPATMPEPVTHGIRLVSLLVYIFIMVFTAFSARNTSKVLVDELSMQNESKANQFALALVMLVIFVGMTLTMVNESDLAVSYDLLFCLIIGIVAAKDAAYLILEKRGGLHAELED